MINLNDTIKNTINDVASAFKIVQMQNEKKRLISEIKTRQDRVYELEKLLGERI